MVTGTPVLDDAEHEPDSVGPVRPRDATDTRQRLLEAARRRFARDGYSGTTVRDIAADAGVNMSLINRYFTSKEGLFEACLKRAVADLDRPAVRDTSVEHMVTSIVSRLTELPSGEHPLELLLLLRSSGDERADAIRRDTLRSFAEGMAATGGWAPGTDGDDDLLLRAQVALSTVLGITLLRASTQLEPLTSATGDELSDPVRRVIAALLSPAETGASAPAGPAAPEL